MFSITGDASTDRLIDTCIKPAASCIDDLLKSVSHMIRIITVRIAPSLTHYYDCGKLYPSFSLSGRY